MTVPGRGPGVPDGRVATFVGGAVFLVSGTSLVVHVLTGAPLWALLAGLVVAASVAVSKLVWSSPPRRAAWVARCRTGAIVGVAATAAYDLTRWLLVELVGFHTSPFAALPFFGEALLGGIGDPTARTIAGVGFHVVNGVTFGITYMVWFGDARPWSGVPFAFGLEAFMLALYPGWLDLRSLRELTEVSLLGHLVYGLALGGGAALARARAVPEADDRHGRGGIPEPGSRDVPQSGGRG